MKQPPKPPRSAAAPPPPPAPSSIAADLRSLLSVPQPRRTKLFLSAFFFAFVAFTTYLAFSPAANSSAAEPYRSQLSSLVSYVFPNSSLPPPLKAAPLPRGTGKGEILAIGKADVVKNATENVGVGSISAVNRNVSNEAVLMGSEVKVKNSTGSGIAVQGSGSGSGVSLNDQGNGGGVSHKDDVLMGKNKTGGGDSTKNKGSSGFGFASNGNLAVSENRTAKGATSSPVKNQSSKGNKSDGLQSAKTADLAAGKNQTLKVDNSKGNAIKSKENAVSAVNKSSKGVSASKASRSSTTNETGIGSNVKENNISVKTAAKSQGHEVVTNQQSNGKIGAGSAKNGDIAVVTKNQTGKGDGLKQNGISATLVKPQENNIATKNQSSKGTATIVNLVSAKNQSGNGGKSSGTSETTTIPKDSQVGEKNQSSEGNVLRQSSKTLAANAGSKGASPAVKSSSLATSLINQNDRGVKNIGYWVNGMKGCDIFQGRWVKDDSYPLYPEGSCPHIDEPFDCYLNGRPDRAYQKLRWQPNGCKIPRLNATDMLERLRGKRLVYAGDSLNRNMWESMVCVLRNSVVDKKKVFEASGRHEFRTEGSYSFVFKDYNCSVEFFRSPFLVQEWEVAVKGGKAKETLRLDVIERSSSKYKDADVIVFNTGHWWTHEKTAKGKDYYQEGNRIYGELNVVEAFHKALNTWAKWVDANVNPKKTLVVFRGYSASHFRGGQWNSGGQCDKETELILNEKYLSSYPPKMAILESVIKGMKTPVSYLNITRLTDYRKDAHPSIYRKQNLNEEERRAPERFQDCSHWCLPGVPDSWNELLYAQLLLKQHK